MSKGQSKTRRLAKILGLIERFGGDHGFAVKIVDQDYDYLMVLDFESTCWKDSRKVVNQEIIEFPAVLLDLSNGKFVSEFHEYVQPMESPRLSDFCKELTGISQARVDDSAPLGTCLHLFSKWVLELRTKYGVYFVGEEPSAATNISPGRDQVQKQHQQTPQHAQPFKKCALATWSDWDLGVCLLYECRRKQLRKPQFLNHWIDIRAVYRSFYNRKPKGLAGALSELRMTFDGREHCGLDDARNTALLCYRMAQDGHRWKITKSLESPQQIVRQPAKLPSEQHLSSTVTSSTSNTSCVNGSTSGDGIGNGRHAELSAASPVLPVRSSLHSAGNSTTTANPPRPLRIASEQSCCHPSSAAHTHATTISAGSTSHGNALSTTSAVAASAVAATVGQPGQYMSTTTTASSSSLLHNDNRSVTNACLNRPQPKASAQPPSSSYTTAAAASVTTRQTQHTSVSSSRRHISSKATVAAATGVAPLPTSPTTSPSSCVSLRATTCSLSRTTNAGNCTISAPASFLNRPKPAAVAAASTDVEPGRAQPAELLGTAQSEPQACSVSAQGSSSSAAYPVTQPIQTQGLTNVACTYAAHHKQNSIRAQPRESTNERSCMSTHTTRERAVASCSLKKSTAQDQVSAQQCSTVLGSVRTNVQQPHSRSNSSCTTLMAPRTLLDSGPSGMMTSSSSGMVTSSAGMAGHSRSGGIASQTRRRLGNSTILTPAKRVCVRAASSHSQSVQYSSRDTSAGRVQPVQSLPHDHSPRATSRDLAPGPGTVATGNPGGDVRNVSTPAGAAMPCGHYVSAPSLPPRNTADPGAVGELPVVATVRDFSTASRGCTGGCTGIACTHTESVHETTTHCT
eukprot:scpid46504/ scgid1097/ ERI1 exoribonuclease 2; Exonuclease domain-containing protein 1